MRLIAASFTVLALSTIACARQAPPAAASQKPATTSERPGAPQSYAGFDRNDYPGDDALPALRQHFSFAGYWLNNPPGANRNTWTGRREALLHHGFGFLVLANGRLDAEILKAQKSGTTPAALGQKDAADAVAAAQREGFPARAILFLDQEEGGHLLDEQAAYLFAWTEAVAHSRYLPGVYASGQAVSEGPGQSITTAQDIRQHVAAQHLHEIALWVAQDACPPSNGCSMQPPPLSSSGTPDVAAWQYAQSPRRNAITAACAKTYAADGNCYAPGLPKFFLDLNVAGSADPSHGR
jgi:hypothetical protein